MIDIRREYKFRRSGWVSFSIFNWYTPPLPPPPPPYLIDTKGGGVEGEDVKSNGEEEGGI